MHSSIKSIKRTPVHAIGLKFCMRALFNMLFRNIWLIYAFVNQINQTHSRTCDWAEILHLTFGRQTRRDLIDDNAIFVNPLLKYASIPNFIEMGRREASLIDDWRFDWWQCNLCKSPVKIRQYTKFHLNWTKGSLFDWWLTIWLMTMQYL